MGRNGRKIAEIRFLGKEDFNQTKGADILDRLVRPTSWTPEVVMEVSKILCPRRSLQKDFSINPLKTINPLNYIINPLNFSHHIITQEFTMLAAASAVLSYASYRLGTQFLPHSMNFTYNSPLNSSQMSIDPATVSNLELLRGTGGSGRQMGGKQGSLFGAIDNTVTGGGARLLRANILAPPTRLVKSEPTAIYQ